MLAPNISSAAVRIDGVGCFLGPPLDMKSVSAGIVWHHIRGILRGNRSPMERADGVHREAMAGDQVLKDITLDIEKSSVVCLVGPSGSGKTALLKVLARKLPPTSGRVELRGRVNALVSVGENLNSNLTAMENIEQHCELMGIRPDGELHVQEIIEFAQLERFRDIPVRRYSTGMAMRLSVALALQGEPDILVMDDVLGVGDIAFQQRCVERLLAMRAAGCTMVLALSDEGLVGQLATRIVTLNGGMVVGDELPHQRLLGQHGFGTAEVSWQTACHYPENDAAAVRDIRVARVGDTEGAALEIEMAYDLKIAPQRCRPLLDVVAGRVQVFRSLYPCHIAIAVPRVLRVSTRIPVHLLSEGSYVVSTALTSLHGQEVSALKHTSAIVIEVRRNFIPPDGAESIPIVTPRLAWQVEPLREGT